MYFFCSFYIYRTKTDIFCIPYLDKGKPEYKKQKEGILNEMDKNTVWSEEEKKKYRDDFKKYIDPSDAAEQPEEDEDILVISENAQP